MTEDPLAFQLFTEIGIIDQLAGTAFERALPAGMTRAQFTVLHHLSRIAGAPQSPARLADAIQVSRATMTSTVGRLIQRQLVEVLPDPADGRGKLVQLTADGRAMRESCIAAVAPLLPLVDGVYAREELLSLLAQLKRLRERLDQDRG
ncbi:MAG: MarR family transcriptional regulator [Novosphingobium sp.]